MDITTLLSSFLGIEFYDNDFEKLTFRFFIALIFIFITVRGLYYPIAKKKEYAFSYMILGIVIFFISFTLKKFELGTGMALGLFAIFGIIRYRTDAMPVKEMTYLFIVIGLSIINALSNKKVSYTEILFTNVVIVTVTYLMERVWFNKSLAPTPKPPKPEAKQSIIYEDLEMVKLEKRELLLEDLTAKTGLTINRIKVDLINYKEQFAQITIYYKNS